MKSTFFSIAEWNRISITERYLGKSPIFENEITHFYIVHESKRKSQEKLENILNRMKMKIQQIKIYRIQMMQWLEGTFQQYMPY